jgi:hypothetical protein
MHEYLQMPPAAAAAYIAYWVVCGVYALYVVAASLLSPVFRARVHRGTWLHIAEGWVLIGVAWAAWAWARHELIVSDQAWSGAPPLPGALRVAAAALVLLQPIVWLAPVVMGTITLVHLWPRASPATPARPAH